MNLHLRQTVSPRVMQRTLLVGRVKMAQAIQMPESEWAKMLSEVEKDSLFQELMTARAEGRRIIRYKRFSHTKISGQFYEMQDSDVVGGGGQSPETLLSQKQHLLKLIEKVGQANFEKFFLYREEHDSPQQLSLQCGITADEAKQLQDFILDMSVQAEFYHPSGINTDDKVRPTLVGRIVTNEDGTFSISFFSPHLARGMYEIDHNALRRWQKAKKLDRTGAARLRRYVGILELSNLKQGAFWRVIDFLLVNQKAYLASGGDITKMAPYSLRDVAKELQFAPSTISRVLAAKSVLLPWDREVMLLHLMPGQRRIVLSILEKVLLDGRPTTDMALSRKIAEDYNVKVSRRTITACRHVLRTQQKAA